MKTLQEIKDEYAKSLDHGVFKSWLEYRDFNEIHEMDLIKIAKLYAREVAKQALINASKNAKIIKSSNIGSFLDASVYKRSISDENNIPNLD